MPSDCAASNSGARHFALEETVDLGVVFHPPARKEGGQSEFREDHDVAAARLGLAHLLEQPRYHLLARFVAGDRPGLGTGDVDEAFHGAPLVQPAAQST
jgi:hypothetical protein